MRNFKFTGSALLLFLAMALLVSPLGSVVVSQAADPTPIPIVPMPPITVTPTGTPGVPPPLPSPTPSGPPYVRMPVSADWERTANSPVAKVKATIELPGAAFEIAWGPLSKLGATFIAETRIWGVGDVSASATSYTHEYSLGDVPTGQYLFILRDWGNIIGAEIVSFVSTTATPTPAPSPSPRPSPWPTVTPIGTPIPPIVTAAGHLVKLPPSPLATASVMQTGTHGLTRNGQLVVALVSSTVNLDAYIDQNVIVWGNPMITVALVGVPPLINVLGIAAMPPVPSPTPIPAPSVTPTPRPSVTPIPAPSPLPTPTPRGAVVRVGPAKLQVGKSTQIPVIVRNIKAPGLGAYEFKVNYNPAVIRVDDVAGGAAPFDSIAAKNINNSAGQVAFNDFQAANSGPTGDIVVAYLSITAVATTLSATPVDVTIVTLSDPLGTAISAVPVRSFVAVLPSHSEAVATLVPAVGQDGRAVLEVKIDRVRNALTNVDVAQPGAIQNFSAQADYNPDLVNVLAIRGAASFASPSADIQNDAGGATFGGSQTLAAAQGPVTLAQILARITGSSADSHILSVSLDALDDGSGNIALDAVPCIRLKRGDAKPDGKIDISDALFVAQFLAGLRPAGDANNQVNVLNGASVRQDGDGGDTLNITDALFIAQHLAGLRDASFNPAP